MLHIGCHLSTTRGFLAMGRTALSLNADTFAFFTRNPRGGRAKPLDLDDLGALARLLEAHHFAPLVAHAPYTMNACASKEEIRSLAQEMMADDLSRLEHLPAGTCFYNVHPGSHVKKGAARGIELIADQLNAVLSPGQRTTVLLETMAGKGTEVGRTFEELRAILDRVEESRREKLGVCLDTCHVWDGGYDIAGDLGGVLDAFDRTIGLERLRAIHLNDSKHPRGSHKDRHEKIRMGTIGLEALVRLIRHPRLRSLPFILETPNELPGYQAEIALLRGRADA